MFIVVVRNGVYKIIIIVKVYVLGVNEYRFFFEILEYKVKVLEVLKVGNLVIKVLVIDYDYGKNGEFNFIIIVGNVFYFSIDKEGVVKI